MSEFGRTLRENGSRGTDHGSSYTLWSQAVRFKAARSRADKQLSAADPLRTTRRSRLNDCRGILANLFGGIYGLSADAIDRVYP